MVSFPSVQCHTYRVPRYSVIVLDESHERNLNTDVLIGLLSVALPLRKKAAAEDPSIVPLKLVLMSATLRVEDFTKNDRLFPCGAPAVVTVPGRTHPVTIHHSKVTELDKYGKSSFKIIHFVFAIPNPNLFRKCCIQKDMQNPPQVASGRDPCIFDRKEGDSSYGQSPP